MGGGVLGAGDGGGGGGGQPPIGGAVGVVAVAPPPKRVRPRITAGSIKEAVNTTLRQKRREVLRPEQRHAVREALLHEALQGHDPYARDEAEGFLSAVKGNLKDVSDAQARRPRMSFDEQREQNRTILNNWYKPVQASLEHQIRDRESQVKLSSTDARKKALEQFKLK